MYFDSDYKPLLSVIIPVYNEEAYLEDCVNSVCNQTHTNLEIILVDDGSTDNSGKICDEFAKKDSRIQVIHKENGGLSSARNAGLDICTGQFITFVDSDDIIHPIMYSALLERMGMYNVAMMGCDFQKIYNDNDAKEFLESDLTRKPSTDFTANSYIEEMYFRKDERYIQFTVCWNKIYERFVFKDIRFPEGKTHEDNFVFAELAIKAQRIAFCISELYGYREHQGSIMTRPFSIERLDKFEGLATSLEFAKKSYLYPETCAYIAEDCMVTAVDYYLRLRRTTHMKDKELKEYRKRVRKVYRKNRKYLFPNTKLRVRALTFCPNLLFYAYSLYKNIDEFFYKIKNKERLPHR